MRTMFLLFGMNFFDEYSDEPRPNKCRTKALVLLKDDDINCCIDQGDGCKNAFRIINLTNRLSEYCRLKLEIIIF